MSHSTYNYNSTLEEFEFVTQTKLPHSLEELNILIPERDGFSSKLTNYTQLKKLGIKTNLFNTITNNTFESLNNIPLESLTFLA